MKSVFALLLMLGSALAKVPTLNGKVITGEPTLSVQLYWTSVPNATYSVYRSNYPNYVCPASNSPEWIEIADDLNVTSYNDIPQSPEYKAWCYAVTATVNNVESAMSNVLPFMMEDGGYLVLGYRTDDCKTIIDIPYGSVFVFTETRNGVVTNVPVTHPEANEFGWHKRIYDDATYKFDVTFPDGDHFVYKVPFRQGSIPGSAAWSTYVDMTKVRNTDPINPGRICEVYEKNYYQPTSKNKMITHGP